MAKRITFGVNDRGQRLGEAHHRAKLTDAEVEEIRTLHENGAMGYKKLAKKFGVANSTVQDICNFRHRATTPDGYKTIVVEETIAFALPMDGALGHGILGHLNPPCAYPGSGGMFEDDDMWWS